MVKNCIKFLFLFLAFTAFQSASAQDFRLIMELVVTEDGKKLPNAEIKVYKNGKEVETVLTDSKGRADIPMGPNGVYDISITGKGMIKKKLNVNTNNVPAENLKGDTFFPAEVDIFPKLDGMDLAILSKPIGKIVYDPGINGFDADMKYTQQMKSQLDKLKSDYEKKKLEEEKAMANKQKEYDAAIKLADKAFSSENWEEAEVQYKKAAAIMPIETYPSFQLAELESKLIAIRATNEKYNQAIKIADEALASKDYQRAISEYKKASGYKPEEEYPVTKLKEAETAASAFLKAEQTYLAAIEKGDNALKINDLNTAKAAFETAAEAKPAESYPKNKLAEINNILGKQEQKEQEYQAAVKAGDEAMTAEDYVSAKASYQKALGVKPTESYPQEQITKAEGLLAAAAKKNQDYLAAVEAADNALAANKLEEAKAAYQSANKIKPKEEYPVNKLKEIADQIAKTQAAEKAYTDKIAEADKALASKDYENAKASYGEAVSLKPAESYPKEKITEIDGILAAAKEADSKYQAAISKADQAFAANKLEEAKAGYNEALAVKPDESYPKEKLTEIEGALIAIEKQNSAYNDAIAKGDEALTAKDYKAAKGFYATASEAKPEEAYPKDKISEIDGIIAANEEKDRNYAAAIEAADNAFKGKNFDQAKIEYNKALVIKPEEAYPKEQIGAIENQLAAAEKLEADYLAAIKNGDAAFAEKNYEKAKSDYQAALSIKSEESYPQEKITEIEGIVKQAAEMEEKYTSAISKADGLLASENYEEAKAAYQEALAVKSKEEYPKTKIAEIDTKLSDIASAKAAAEKLEADYTAAMKEGQSKLDAKKYEEAIASFTIAAGLKAEEKEPKTKIEEIKAIQAQLAAEAAEQERLQKLQADYEAAIKKADDLFTAKSLAEARTEYQAALALKADEAYPQKKIEEINSVLSDAKEQEEKYAAAIAEADKLMANKKFEDAKSKYSEASSIKSEEAYPKDKIKEIDGKLAEIAAAAAAIALENENKQKIQENYNALIEEGTALMQEKKWSEAKSKFQEALELKDEQLPKDKIAAIEASIAAEQNAMAAAEIQEKYDDAIKKADDLFAASNWVDSKSAYQEALAIKSEDYPQSQIDIINEKITEEQAKLAAEASAAEAAKKEAEVQAKYDAAILAADELFAASKWEESTAKYQEALTIKSEDYPQSQIDKINTKIEEEKAKLAAQASAAESAKLEAEYQSLIAQADLLLEQEDLANAKSSYEKALSLKQDEYPKMQIEMIAARIKSLAEKAEKQKLAAQKDADYQAAIAAGDAAIAARQYANAKNQFQNALSIKPEETYPKDKISEIENLQAELASKNAAQNEQYNAAIAAADLAFQNESFDEARNKYNEAIQIKSSESYPKEQLALIDKTIDERAAKAEQIKLQKEREAKNEAAYQTAIVEGDKFYSNKEYSSAINKYELAKGLSPSKTYPQEQIDKINKQLASQEQAKLDAERKKKELADREGRYKEVIALGDEAYDNKSLNLAKRQYEAALAMKPNEEYPKSRIKTINGLLEEKRLAELEAKNAQEKPIEIQKGPKSSVTGDAEAEIDRIYQEMWAKKNSDKNAKVVAQQSKVNEFRIAEKEGDERKIQEEKQRIEGVAISMQEQRQTANEFYMQNFETVKQKEKDVVEGEKTLSREAERTRNNQMVEEKQIKENEYHSDLQKQQRERSENLDKAYVQKQSDILEQNRKLDSDNLNKNTASINAVIETQKEVYDELNETSEEKRQEEMKTISTKQDDLRQFAQERSDDFEENYEDVKEKEKAIVEEQKRLTNESDAKILDNQSIVQEVSNDQRKIQQNGDTQHKENYIEVVEKTKMLKDEQDQLNAESEKRRQDNKNQKYYEGEKKIRQDPESADYPQGVTEKIIENDNSTTIRRIVVEGTQTDIYEKTLYAYGKIIYTKNGNNITKETWDAESKK